MEKVADLVVGGEETLCLPGRLEVLHLPLSSSRGLVRILDPVVETFVPAVLDAGYQVLRFCCKDCRGLWIAKVGGESGGNPEQLSGEDGLCLHIARNIRYQRTAQRITSAVNCRPLEG
jgi:hypothetical protein